LAGLTRSSKPERNAAARASVLVALLAVAALPVAVALAELQGLFDVEYAAGAAPLALVGGLVALSLARRARVRSERTLGRVGGRGTAAAGRALGVLAVLLAFATGIAAATYLTLERFEERGGTGRSTSF
jgi:hypothetical protein